MNLTICPLCGADGSRFHTASRTYFRCERCRLVFVDRPEHVSAERERAEYELHENAPEDAGYRRFLSRLADPLAERIGERCRGLDFGCGPGPTLSVMLEEAGHTVAIYDPFFAPDASVLDHQYDFVTATEVVEHLRDPRTDLERMWGCVRPGGVLGIMTKLVRDHAAFTTWHYTNDVTHVVFFSRETFDWLADAWRTSAEFVGDDVVFFRKPIGAGSPRYPS